MDAILAPERDMKGSLEVRGWGLWFLRPTSAIGQHNSEGEPGRIVFRVHMCGCKSGCVYSIYVHGYVSMLRNRCYLSFCQEVLCKVIDSGYCWNRCASVLTSKAQH